MNSEQHTAQTRLQAAMALLASSGIDPVVVGPGALSLHRGFPLPVGELVHVFASAEPVDEVVQTLSDAVQFHVTGDARQGALEMARTLPIVSWQVIGEADEISEAAPGALEDLDSGRLRLASEPRRWLRGRAERILDVAVWAAQTGLKPTREVVRAARRDAGHLLSLDRAMWSERFNDLLVSWRASVGLQFLLDCGALPLMVHEVCAMVGFHESCPIHHKDIWDHTLQVVDKCPANLAVRWTALMHDTGKVWTRTVTKGKVHFFRHEELGASLMRGVGARFTLDASLVDRVAYVIGNHARANVYSTEWTDSAVRRLIRDMGPHLDDVIAFSRSDYTTKRAWRIREVRELGEELLKRIEAVREADAKVAPLPKGLGNELMKHTGRGPGRWIGDIQRWLEEQVEAQEVDSGLHAAEYIEHIQSRRPELLASD